MTRQSGSVHVTSLRLQISSIGGGIGPPTTGRPALATQLTIARTAIFINRITRSPEDTTVTVRACAWQFRAEFFDHFQQCDTSALPTANVSARSVMTRRWLRITSGCLIRDRIVQFGWKLDFLKELDAKRITRAN